jgi:hypothetical protein
MSHGWIDDLENALRTHTEALILTVAAASEEARDKATEAAVRNLVGIRLGIGLLKNRQRVTQFFIGASLIIFVVAYAYIGILLSFAYYGLARVQNIPYSWTEALVTSLFIPAAYGDLPHNVWIKLLGGIHWLLVVVSGIGTLVGYLRKRLNTIYHVVDGLSVRLEEQELSTKLELLREKLNITSTPSAHASNENVSSKEKKEQRLE